MRAFLRALADLVDESEFWLSLVGLLLIGAGLVFSLLHLFAYPR